MKYLITLPLVSLLLVACSALAVESGVFPGKKSKWQGFDMYQDGGRKVIAPAKVAEGKPWVWRARFFGHQPQFDVALLKRGYHLVYCNVGGLYGNAEAVERWNAFYKYLREEHGFAEKAILEGMSRGGLIIYNWGIANPEKVAVIYGDAPVMDFKSWPGHANGGILKAYGFKNPEEAKAYKGNPVDNLKPLADAGVPIIHVVGDADTVVPVSENTAIAEKRYQEMGGVFKVIHKEKVGHHPHSLKDPAPLVDFVLKHTSGKKGK
jgi:pimeloyl-ACP methyl ester carboxylesterase